MSKEGGIEGIAGKSSHYYYCYTSLLYIIIDLVPNEPVIGTFTFDSVKISWNTSHMSYCLQQRNVEEDDDFITVYE